MERLFRTSRIGSSTTYVTVALTDIPFFVPGCWFRTDKYWSIKPSVFVCFVLLFVCDFCCCCFVYITHAKWFNRWKYSLVSLNSAISWSSRAGTGPRVFDKAWLTINNVLSGWNLSTNGRYTAGELNRGSDQPNQPELTPDRDVALRFQFHLAW